MIDIQKPLEGNPLREQIAGRSVLAIPGILRSKPILDPVIGKGWLKKKQNGKSYYKMKFDCFVTPKGKPLYGKCWPLKSELGAFIAGEQ